MNNLREIRKIIYQLKRQYGQSIDYFYPSEIQVPLNLETGYSPVTYNTFKVRKAIKLVSKDWLTFKYALSFIAANKNFTYGGYFDTTELILILDAKDLLVNPAKNHYVIINSQKYEFMSISIADHNQAYEIKLKGIKDE